MIVAYFGGPNERVFGRVKWQTMEVAMIDCFHNGTYWGLHDTDTERLPIDDVWDNANDAQLTSTNTASDAIQVDLFEN